MAKELEKSKSNFEKLKSKYKLHVKQTRDEKEKLISENKVIAAENEEKCQKLKEEFEFSLSKNKNELENVKEKLQSSTEEKERMADKYSKEIRELTELLENKNHELEELASTSKDVAVEFETLRQESEVLKAEKGEVDSSIKAEFDNICLGLRSDLQKAHNEISELQTAANVSRLDLERQLVDKEVTCQGLMQMVAEQRDTISSLTDYVELSKKEIKPLEEKYQQLLREKEELEGKIEELVSNLTSLSDERDKIIQEQQETKRRLAGEVEKAYLEKAQVCQQLRSNFEQTVEEKDAILSDLREKLKEGRMEREKFEAQQNDILIEQQHSFELTIQELKESLEKSQHEKEEMFERLVKDSEKGREELTDGLQREFETIVSEKEKAMQEATISVGKLQEDLKCAMDEKNDLVISFRTAEKEIETLNSRLEQLQDEKDIIAHQMANELEKQAIEKGEALESMRTELEDLVRGKEETIESLKANLQSVKDECVELELALNEKEVAFHEEAKENEELNHKLQEFKEEKDQVFSEWEKELADVESRFEAIQSENEKSSVVLAEKNNEIEVLQSKLANRADENDQLRDERDKLCTSVNGLHKFVLDKFHLDEIDGHEEDSSDNIDRVLAMHGLMKTSIEKVANEREDAANKVDVLLQENSALLEQSKAVSAKAQNMQHELEAQVADLLQEKEDATVEKSYLDQQLKVIASNKAEIENKLASEMEQASVYQAEAEKRNKVLEDEILALKNLVSVSERVLEPKIEQAVSVTQEASPEQKDKEDDRDKHKNEVVSLCSELETVKASNEKLKAKLRQLMKRRGKTEAHEGETQQLRQELETLRQEKLDNAKTSQEIRVELDEVVREKDRIVGELKGRMQQIVNDKEHTEAVAMKYEALLGDRETALKVLNSELTNFEMEMKSKDKEMEVIKVKLTATASENKELVIKVNDLQQQIMLGEQDIAVFQAEKERSKDDKDAQIEHQQEELKDLRKKQETATRTILELTDKLNEAVKEQEDINKLRSDFNHIVSSLRDDVEHAQKGRSTADQLASEFQMQLRRLETGLPSRPHVSSKDQNDDGQWYEEVIAEKEKEVAEITASLEQRNEEIIALKAELDRVTEQFIGKGKELEETDVKNTLQEENSDSKSLQEEVKELKSTNDELQQKLEDLRESNGSFSQLEETRDRLEKENRGLSSQIGELTRELQNSLKGRNELEHILQGLREDLQSAMSDKDVKDKALHSMRIEIDRLKRKIPTDGKPVPVILPLEIKHVSQKSPVEESVSPTFVQDIYALSHEEPQSFGMEKEDQVKSIKPEDAGSGSASTIEVISPVVKEKSESSTTQGSAQEESLQKKLEKQTKLNSRLKHMAKGLKADVQRLNGELERINTDRVEKEQSIKNLRIDVENLVQDKEKMVEGFRQRLIGLADDKGKAHEALKSEYEMIISQKDDTVDHLKTELEATQLAFMKAKKHLEIVGEENITNAEARSELALRAGQLEAKLRHVSIEKEEIKRENEERSEIIQEKTARSEDLSKRNTDLEDIISDLRKDLETMIKHRAELEQKIGDVQTDLNTVTEERDRLIDIIKEKPTNDRDVENAEFDKEIAREREDLYKKLETELHRSRNRVKELNQKNQEAVTVNIIQKQEYEENVSGLRNEIERLSSEKTESEQRIQEMRLEMEKFVTEKDEIVENLRNKMKNAVEEHGGLAAGMKSEYERMIEEKDSQLQSLLNERKTLDNDKGNVLDELEDTKKQLQKVFADKVLLENKLKATTALSEKLDHELHRLQGVRNQSDEQKLLKDLQESYNELEDKLKNLVTDREKLRDDLEKSLKDKENVRARMKRDFSRINATLNKELEDAKNLAIDKEKSLQELRLEIETIVKDKETLSARIRKRDVDRKGAQSPGATPEGFGNVLHGMKGETNRLLRELHGARKEKEDLFEKFQRTCRSLRKDLEKAISDREAISDTLDHTKLAKKDVEKALREKDSAIVKLKANFEHIGRGWRNDLETARKERDDAILQLERKKGERIQSDGEGTQMLSVMRERDKLEIKYRELEGTHLQAVEKTELYERQFAEINSRVTVLEQQKNILEYDLENTRKQLQKALERTAEPGMGGLETSANETTVHIEPQVRCGS